MNREDLKRMVAQLLEEMGKTGQAPPSETEEACLPDPAEIKLRETYLVKNPVQGEAFLALKRKTPARLGMGRAGTRYLTQTMLRFRADHAAAQDSVFSLVPEEFAKQNGLISLKTMCRDKEEYLTRPDLGRRFDEANRKVIREVCKGQRVILVVGDGLSSAAITANAMDCAQAIRHGLKSSGIELGKGLFVQFCRVGASDHIGEISGCELVCMLVGERPGLVSSESMSAYLTYRPHPGIPEASRSVVSNIHRNGIAPVEAGAHIAALIEEMLRKKASGLALQREAEP